MRHVVFCFLAAIGLVSTAQAGTLFVEIFGTNNSACSKTAPCRTIEHALDTAGTNDRILVGPGIYSENAMVLGTVGTPVHGVKLQSVAGSGSVLILSGNSPMLTVFGDKFTLGGKGRGFEFFTSGANENKQGVVITGERAKIEGNFFDNQDSGSGANSSAAIRVENTDGKNTIRYNRITGFSTGIFLDIDNTSKSIISENEISDASYRCVTVSATRGSDKITKNIMQRCSDGGVGNGAGVYMFFTDTDNPGASKPKFDRNRVFNLGSGSGFIIDEARPTITRNLLSTLDRGLLLSDTLNAVVKDNLIQNSDLGVSLSNSTLGTTIQGNTMSNLETHIFIRNSIFNNTTLMAKSISKNNFLVDQGGAYCPIAMFNDSVNPADPDIVFSRNFWGLLDDTFDHEPDLAGTNGDCSNSNTLNTYNAGNLVFNNPATKPNPLKYKGDGSY